MMDDDADIDNLNACNGTLPDGKFDDDTMFYYCCRSDGSLYEPIVLPSDQPFQLLLGKYEEQCQEVAGMTSSVLHTQIQRSTLHTRCVSDGT